jgi:hypothetical protein
MEKKPECTSRTRGNATAHALDQARRLIKAEDGKIAQWGCRYMLGVGGWVHVGCSGYLPTFWSSNELTA